MNDEAPHTTDEMTTRHLPRNAPPVVGDEAPPSIVEGSISESSPERWAPPDRPPASESGQDWRDHLKTAPIPIPVAPVGVQTGTRPAAESTSPQATQRLGCSARLAILIALLLSVLALASNLIFITTVLRLQSAATASLDNTITQLQNLCGPDATPIMFPISQTIHFKGDIALPSGMNFPFKGDIPIRTTVRISIPGLPGGPMVEVPINTVVPVDTQVALPDGMRFPIDTAVPIRQEIPIDLCMKDGPVNGFLEQAIQSLLTIRKDFSFP